MVVAVGGQSPRYPVALRHMVPHPKEVGVSTPDAAEAARRRPAAGGSRQHSSPSGGPGGHRNLDHFLPCGVQDCLMNQP
ncbi:hypothetical protein [Streptomyces sp. NPDC003998]